MNIQINNVDNITLEVGHTILPGLALGAPPHPTAGAEGKPMDETIEKFGTAIGQVVFAALVLIFMLGFTASAAMDWVAEKQQEKYFLNFKNQVKSACTSLSNCIHSDSWKPEFQVKSACTSLSNPQWGDTTRSEYIVLYPYYDIRYYSKIGEAPAQVAQACKGDKCACLVKAYGKGSWFGTDESKLEGVYACHTLSCDYELYFGAMDKDTKKMKITGRRQKRAQAKGLQRWLRE